MAAEKDDSRIVPVHFCRVTVIFRIHEYGDKVKVLISWKSVDFKPQF